MTDDDKEALIQAIPIWREEAAKVGPLHSDWELVFDAEAALSGKKTYAPVSYVIQQARLILCHVPTDTPPS